MGAKINWIASLVFALTACQTMPHRPQPSVPGVYQPSSSKGSSSNREIPNVALILGPGGAKALAHAGVIKALQENRIPVDRIVGVEWGALVAAAFAAHGQAHEVDWKLYKLDQVDLANHHGFFGLGGGDRSIKIMDRYLKDNFGNMDFGATKIPFSCPSRLFWTGALVWQHRGLLSDGIRKCLPFPPFFKVHGSWQAAATHLPEVVQAIRNEGYKLIIFVDVLGTASPFPKEKFTDDPLSVILWQDVERSVQEAAALSNEVIRVPTESYLINRFDARKELIQAGEQEGAKAAQSLSAKYGF